MPANNSAPERKQIRDSLLVGRDKASPETVQYLNELRDQIQDPKAAEAVALLHAQVNGDHPDYARPPDRKPFGHWHAAVDVETPTITNTSSNGATAEVALSTFKYLNAPAQVNIRFVERSPAREIVETPTQEVSDTTPLEFSTTALNPDTEYKVNAVASADVDVRTLTATSNNVFITTSPQ